MLWSGQESVTSAVRRMPSQLLRQAGAGEAGRRRGLTFVDGFDARGVAFAQFVGFAGNAEEGSGGLLAGHGGGGLGEREGGLDPVAGVDAVGHMHGAEQAKAILRFFTAFRMTTQSTLTKLGQALVK